MMFLLSDKNHRSDFVLLHLNSFEFWVCSRPSNSSSEINGKILLHCPCLLSLLLDGFNVLAVIGFVILWRVLAVHVRMSVGTLLQGIAEQCNFWLNCFLVEPGNCIVVLSF